MTDTIINVLSIVAIIWFALQLFTAGYKHGIQHALRDADDAKRTVGLK